MPSEESHSEVYSQAHRKLDQSLQTRNWWTVLVNEKHLLDEKRKPLALSMEETVNSYQMQMFSPVIIEDLYRWAEWHCVGLSVS